MLYSTLFLFNIKSYISSEFVILKCRSNFLDQEECLTALSFCL